PKASRRFPLRCWTRPGPRLSIRDLRFGRVKILVNLLRQLRCDLWDRGQLGDRGLAYPPGRTQRLQEAGPNGRSDAGNRVEHRLDRPPAPQLLVVGDREPMGLVANLL